MTHHTCNICRATTPSDRACHYCGAFWLASLHHHIDICTGRILVRGFYKSYGVNSKVPKSIATAVAMKQARKQVSA